MSAQNSKDIDTLTKLLSDSFSRRKLLKWAGVGAAGFLSTSLESSPSQAQGNSTLGRLVVFYFPDGVPGQSERGDPNLWNCTGGVITLTCLSV